MNELIYLSSWDNPKIKEYRKLALSVRERKKNGLFVAEGVRLVSDAISEGASLHCAFFTDDAVSRHEELFRLAEARCGKGHVFGLSPAAAKALSDTENSQGVFAVCGMPAMHDISRLRKGGKYIVLDNVQDPGNMGTMLRTADACGIDGVMLCGGCDPFSPKAVRSAMGSVLRVPLMSESFENAAAAFNAAGIPLIATVIDSGAEDIRTARFTEGAAAVIGNEGSGMPAEHIALCGRKITIKMNGTVNSLNAAMAAGIIMWEITR